MASNKQAFGQKSQTFEKKLVGIVSVKTGDTKAKFTLLEDGKTFKNGEKSLTVALEDLPTNPPLQHNDKSGTKQYRIRMNNDGDEVEALTPVVGVFDMKAVALGPRPNGEDSDPMPKERVFDEGGPKENRHFEFFCSYQIISGNYKGVVVPAYYLHYKFQEDEHNSGFAGFTFSLQNKQATRGKQLADWGHLHGVWEVQGTEVMGEPIRWDDETILPEIEERVLENDATVRGVFKNGYIVELLPSEELPDFVDEDELAEEVDTKFSDKTASDAAKKVIARGPKLEGRNTPKKISKKSSDDDDL